MIFDCYGCTNLINLQHHSEKVKAFVEGWLVTEIKERIIDSEYI